jgi:choline kinase
VTTAIVLAAGLGRRLATETTLPKWLTPVNSTCPALEQLRSFGAAGIDDALVVVGDAEPEISEALSRWDAHVPVRLVPNPHSASLNNWFSLLLGLEAWLATDRDDVVVVNSDLFASSEWFEALLHEVLVSAGDAVLAVDATRGRTDEAMKVSLDRINMRVTGIGKRGIEEIGGEYVGLAWWNRQAAKGIVEHLAAFVGVPERADCWYEHAIQEHLADGAHYTAVSVPSTGWVEIDDQHDLAAARSMVL